MCSLFWQMENDQGDLSDIVRASGGGGGSSATATAAPSATSTSSAYGWSFPAEPISFPSRTDDGIDDFSGPAFRGPTRGSLLHEAEISSSAFYHRLNPGFLKRENDFSHSTSHAGDGLMSEEMKPSQLLTRVLPNIGTKPKIPIPSSNSSSLSPAGIKPLQNEGVKVNSLGGPNENGSLPSNSPRNTGIKRRKSQTKKVVCVPAPAAPNNRPSGEVVPSDLWAWRKYGQKPIKGSPYPRGYYRCSSSKGCSARKQVERSRTDPNKLVITYTSEHNHPWPTERNALAGSTRSQPSKSDPGPKLVSPQNQNPIKTKDQRVKEELKNATSYKTEEGSSTICANEEEDEMGGGKKSAEVDDEGEARQDFQGIYRPIIPPEASQSDDFFSELGELEPNPLSLIFPDGFSTDEKSNEDSENKGLDPFSFFDWSDSSLSAVRKGL